MGFAGLNGLFAYAPLVPGTIPWLLRPPERKSPFGSPLQAVTHCAGQLALLTCLSALQVLQLLQRREKYLALGAIRFVRTCLGLKDDFYHRCALSLLSHCPA